MSNDDARAIADSFLGVRAAKNNAGKEADRWDARERVLASLRKISDAGVALARLAALGIDSDQPLRAQKGAGSPVADFVNQLIGREPGAGSKAGWDADAAIARIRKWASSDGSGDPAKISWSKYRQAFAVEEGDGNKLGDFSYPHHTIEGGRLVLSAPGVQAGWNAASGGRTGRRNAVAQQHLMRHREELAKAGAGKPKRRISDDQQPGVSRQRVLRDDEQTGGKGRGRASPVEPFVRQLEEPALWR